MKNPEKAGVENINIVTDPGIDDVIALALLNKLSPQTPINIIPTFGNAPVEVTGQNAKEFIAAVAPHWKFVKGPDKPQNGTLECKYPDYFHGPDGVWGVHPGVDTSGVVENNSFPDGHVYSIGPMSAVAKMVDAGQVQKLTVMGGAFEIEGNETPYAETNIRFDPDAAAFVFKSVKPKTVLVVPLDVTRKVAWSLEIVESIPVTDSMSKWVKGMLLEWLKNGSHEREEVFNLHDPLAIYLSFYPEHAKWKSIGVAVIVDGEKRGQTIYDENAPIVSIAIGLDDGEKIVKDIFRILFCK